MSAASSPWPSSLVCLPAGKIMLVPYLQAGHSYAISPGSPSRSPVPPLREKIHQFFGFFGRIPDRQVFPAETILWPRAGRCFRHADQTVSGWGEVRSRDHASLGHRIRNRHPGPPKLGRGRSTARGNRASHHRFCESRRTRPRAAVRSRFRGVLQTDNQRPQSSSAPNLTAGFLNLSQWRTRGSATLRQRLGHRHKVSRALLVSYDNCVSAQISARFYCVSPQLPGGFQRLRPGVVRRHKFDIFWVLIRAAHP